MSASVPFPTHSGPENSIKRHSQNNTTNNINNNNSNINPYDQRDLQSKAIRRWEKQKCIWETVQENIRRRVLNTNPIPGACMNMFQGVYQTRMQKEELGLITSAVPSSVFTGFHTWESTLRTSSEEGAVRYLKVGNTNFPYALYSKVTDKQRLDVNHSNNTRVVFFDQELPETLENDDASLSALSLLHPSIETAPISFRGADYYKEKLKKFQPEIQQRMSHFLLPRAYLEVCGQPPPWTTNIKDAKAAKKLAPAVKYFSPPPPPPIDASTSCSSSQPLGSTTVKKQNNNKNILESSNNNKKNSMTSGVQITTQNDSINITENDKTSIVENTSEGGPCLEISNTRILFFSKPGELVHGSVKIKNTGTTTVYYTWAPFQPTTALDNENEYNDIQKDEKEEENEKKNLENYQILKLRSLAEKSSQSKSFFFLSSPHDGVILPDDEEIFPFSVRAQFTGRFTQYYELLMIPVLASRVIVELCAIVRDGGPSLEYISQPVAEAIEAKVNNNIPRNIINEIASNPIAYEAAEIAKATQDCINIARAPLEAHEALMNKWRKSWYEYNYPALRISFNRDVYERLEALHKNLAKTMNSLGYPLHHEEWDGSIETLQSNICLLRDAMCRNTLREAINILLKAARLSERESDTLDILLRRLAGTIALSSFAEQIGELDNNAAITVGLRPPRTTPPIIASNVNNNNPRVTISNVASPTPARRNIGAGGSSPIMNSLSPHTSAGKLHGKSSTKTKSTALDTTLTRATLAEELHSPVTMLNTNTNNMNDISDSILGGDPILEAAAREEYKARLFAGVRQIVGDCVGHICSNYDASRRIIEAACGLSLLETIASVRGEEVRVIQSYDEMEVDFTVDVVPQKKKR